MGVIQRNTKTSSGSRSFAGGTVIDDNEVDADFDTVYTLVNGNIDEDNIDPAAQIPNSSLVIIEPSYVNDHSDDDATMLTATSPGDSGTPSKPTTMEGEIERLRYRLQANNSMAVGLKYIDTAGDIQTAGWPEPPRIGRNMLPNPGFELQSGGTGTFAPDGWTLVGGGTPTLTIEGATVSLAGVDKRSLNILASGAGEGISRVVSGLKPGLKYLVGMAYTLTTGEVNLTTTNAIATGEYKEFAYQDTTVGGGYEIAQGIVRADTSGNDITVSITSSANLDDFNLYYVWFYELADSAPVEIPHIPMQTAVDSVELIYPGSPTGTAPGTMDWETILPLSLSQYVPYEGYRFTYEVTVCWLAEEIALAPDVTWDDLCHGLRVQIDGVTDGGEKIIYEDPAGATHLTFGYTMTLRAVVENPTPGTTVAFTTDIGVFSDNASNWAYAIVNPLRPSAAPSQASSSARLYTERI